MKFTTATSKILGVHLGEASLNLMMPSISPIKAKFALVTKDGDTSGYIEVKNWSEKTIEALRVFAAQLEEDALNIVFEVAQSTDTKEPDKPNEPNQF